ncbi:PA2169 family four-helix-bundle protein [Pontibacter sp. BT310]|uniref:PA2169 family four-helix-bundle protein n=2 Tax=Pontibacter populi TaxID=890055 RepID=A0ABS6X6T2_9BACT|nr:PA2169 family four-helix-bundle protein [Pontibacter sp. BT310]MBJ6116865.1 PA2169 family four-helix-bundle protein [Pontibacter sp. BT310]MBR0569287.1 PA2169 family four-helix-bundle protein [Microvirga sp. STS03]MBW3363718.1 PA2169 family four-helix-bundle protein [Pontibacter populi]
MKNMNERTSEVINELTQFVNDRIEGYKTAAKETRDPAHKAYYNELVGQSQQFSNELNSTLSRVGGDMQHDTTIKGKLYRGWMDVKSGITGKDEKAIIDSNLYGEEWAQKAYNDALEHKAELPQEVVQMVEKQKQASLTTCEHLKQMKTKAD